MCSSNKSSALCSYSLITWVGGLGILQCHLGFKRSSTLRAPRPQHLEPPIQSLVLTSSPSSLPPNKSWSTEWHQGNKALFHRRLQLQQEGLWLGVCLKCYQYHDHSCRSTNLSLITIPWLHLRLRINLLGWWWRGAMEKRGVICLTRSTCNDKAIPFSVDDPPAHRWGQIFTWAGKLSVLLLKKGMKQFSLCYSSADKDLPFSFSQRT